MAARRRGRRSDRCSLLRAAVAGLEPNRNVPRVRNQEGRCLETELIIASMADRQAAWGRPALGSLPRNSVMRLAQFSSGRTRNMLAGR